MDRPHHTPHSRGRYSLRVGFLAAWLATLPLITIHAQVHIGGGVARMLFQQHCAACHGGIGEGGKGGSLLRTKWKYVTGDEDAGLADIIRKGVPRMGMEPFASKLSEGEIRTLVIFMKEARFIDREMRARQPPPNDDQVFHAAPYHFRVETLVRSAEEIWSLANLPDGRLLFTEKSGALRLFDPAHPEVEPRTITGTPRVWFVGLGGLLDVVLHPDYVKNGWIYLTYAERNSSFFGGDGGMIAVVRGRIRDDKWVDQQEIFHLPPRFFSWNGDHIGCRLVIKDGFLFFTIGDRGDPPSAQDPGSPNGKIFRLTDDGKIPPDNPFPSAEGPLAGIWSSGHRNPEGLVFEPGTGLLWEAEHGPRGGDEVNVILRGGNYGWPLLTHGMREDGTAITTETTRPGFESPRHHWTPSIAVCAITFYEGDKFPDWRGSLFAGGLHSEELHRLTVKDGAVTADEVILRGIGRIRDVKNSPDGSLHLALNFVRRDGSRIVRIVPVTP